jgi:hypothetical protein
MCSERDMMQIPYGGDEHAGNQGCRNQSPIVKGKHYSRLVYACSSLEFTGSVKVISAAVLIPSTWYHTRKTALFVTAMRTPDPINLS